MYNSVDEDKPHTIIVSGELGLNTWNNKTTVQLIGNKIEIIQQKATYDKDYQF